VLETPLDRFDSFLTPAELFYIRSHFPAPKIELASYRLQIDGAVSRPFSLGWKPRPTFGRVALISKKRLTKVGLDFQARLSTRRS
jgi:hypothetical protein